MSCRSSRLRRVAKRTLACGLLAEAGSWAHYRYAKAQARAAPTPGNSGVDKEYGEKFLSLARCDGRTGPDACASFVRHAFFGAAPESLPRSALANWLSGQLQEHEPPGAFSLLESALGPNAPKGAEGPEELPAFVYGKGPLEAWPKPFFLRLLFEVQRFSARARLRAEGFVERQDPQLPALRYLERPGEGPPLVILHGYGRGLASPLFEGILPALGRRPVVIVDCAFLLVARLPRDVRETPSVRELAQALASHLAGRGSVDVLAHSFGTAVASALVRAASQPGSEAEVRRVVLMDPMCFMPGITKQAQLLRRKPGSVAAEMLQELDPGAPAPSPLEVLKALCRLPDPAAVPGSAEEAAQQRRQWVLFQSYFFTYFVYRDLVYSWLNVRLLHGPDYLDRGLLRSLNRQGRLLTILAESDLMIPAGLLRDDLSAEAAAAGPSAGVLWLPVVGHGACQHRDEVTERVQAFLTEEA